MEPIKITDGRITRTQAIANLLPHVTWPDLVALYCPEMEVQVTVAQDNGTQIQREYQGRNYVAFTDGQTTWKPFRIPWKAATEPEYNDQPMTFDLAEHYEGIGMTGWNWKLRQSIYVAFDFDAIVGSDGGGHAVGLSPQEMEAVKQAAIKVPYVTMRKSTSGSGIHIYIPLKDVFTANHAEHAAVARAVLSKLSSDTGFDFHSKVDTCGGNMWIAHRKMNFKLDDNGGESGKIVCEGLKLIKQGEALEDIPINWRDHMAVVTRRRHKVDLSIGEPSDKNALDQLMSERTYVPLDDEHKKIIAELEGTDSWWDADHHLLITHTAILAELHESLGLRGIFRTISTGEGKENDHNVFCSPTHGGGWLVRRFTRNCVEDPSWFQDRSGWTTCYFNRHPDLRSAARAFGGVECEKGGFSFKEASVMLEVATLLGSPLTLPNQLLGRKAFLKNGKDSRLIVKVHREPTDDGGTMEGWEANKDKTWTKIVEASLKTVAEPEIGNYDTVVRHLITEENTDAGWVINNEGRWISEPSMHIRLALGASGFSSAEINGIMGANVTKAWTLTIQPFAPEYPGNRRWNRFAPQFSVTPSVEQDDLHYPHWKMILEHCGRGLDHAVIQDSWCKQVGIITGADYLKCWCASLFQEPLQPLPYLFLYGPQNCGKSILHEALALLFSPGYVRADVALTNPSGFNGELENAILCVVEETDLKANRVAYNRIKDWVTSVRLPIHCKMKTPSHTCNTTHWIQVANDEKSCPVFPGDTRIVIITVKALDSVIPKRELFGYLQNEAADFLAALLSLELPPTNDRLNLPVVMTQAKQSMEESNRTELETFLSECVFYVPGATVTLGEFYNAFAERLDGAQIMKWPKQRISREVPSDKFPKGRRKADAQHCFGNMSLMPGDPIGPVLCRPIYSDYLEVREKVDVNDRYNPNPSTEQRNTGATVC
jgi:hypothetical protein